MTICTLTVSVRKLPETIRKRQAKTFLLEIIRTCAEVSRPQIVLDCSLVRVADRQVIHLLLCCLEESMKRNGNVKLAGVPDSLMARLESTGLDRLFETFDSEAAALCSFQRASISPARQQLAGSDGVSASANSRASRPYPPLLATGMIRSEQ